MPWLSTISEQKNRIILEDHENGQSYSCPDLFLKVISETAKSLSEYCETSNFQTTETETSGCG